MTKVTLKQKKQYLKLKLSTDYRWMTTALIRIYEFQTREEQNAQTTMHHNDVGFSGADGEILSSFAVQFQRRGSLSPRQCEIGFKKIPKYWKQLLNLSDNEKLENQIRKHKF